MKIGILTSCHCVESRFFSLSSDAVGGAGWGEEAGKENVRHLVAADYHSQAV